MTWQDDGITVYVDISTDGDVMPKTTTAAYPFLSSSGGVATGWTQYLALGAIAAEVNWTVSSNGQCVSNALTTGQLNKQYGIQRDFPARLNQRYVIGLDVRTMENKAEAFFEYHVYSLNGAIQGPEVKANVQIRTELGWQKCQLITEPLSATQGHAAVTGLRVIMHGRYNLTDQQNWGYQVANVWITEVDQASTALAWQQVQCDVKAASVRYGRARFNERFDVATCSLVLDNTDGDYAYNAHHPKGFRPGRYLRMRASYKSASYPLYWGIIDSVIDGYSLDGRAITTLNCIDLTTLGSAVPVPVARGDPQGLGGAYMGSRIRQLVGVLGLWPQYTAIDAGQWGYQPIRSSGRTVRDEIGVSADSENGVYYATRDGYLTYKDRQSKTYPTEYNQVTADLVAAEHTGTLPNVDSYPTLASAPIIDPNQLQTDWSQARVINRVSLAVQGGVARQFDNTDSQKAYGVKTYQRMDLVCLEDSYGISTLPILADDLMTGWADPVLRVNTISLNPLAQPYKTSSARDSWKWVLSVFPLWLVRVWYINPRSGWGYSTVVYVQSVEHHISATEWEITLSVDQPLTFSAFQLSDVGWDKGIWGQTKWDEVVYG